MKGAAASIVRACAAAGEPALAAGLILSGASEEAVTERLGRAKDIRAKMQAAVRINPDLDRTIADRLVALDAPPERAGAEMLSQIVSMQSPEIAGRHGAAGSGGAGNDWSVAIAAVNAKRARRARP